MIEGKKILAIIPARGGSKGLPGKNIREMCGKPLLAWTIEKAKNSKYIDDIFLSTDSEEIASVGKKFGLPVLELRPDYLASDTATSADVVKHVLHYYKKNGKEYDYILLLEPTSPLRKDDDIDNALELAIANSSADGVISVGEVHMEHPWIVKRISNNRIASYVLDAQQITRRQQADEAYFPYGVLYLIKTDVFLRVDSFYTNNIVPYEIERWQTYEVDDLYDFICIEAIMKHQMEE